jgi:hypothetical protein
MASPDTPSLLEQAARLVEAHIEKIPKGSSVCPHCKRETWDSWASRQETVELEAVVRKLRKFSAKRS